MKLRTTPKDLKKLTKQLQGRKRKIHSNIRLNTEWRSNLRNMPMKNKRKISTGEERKRRRKSKKDLTIRMVSRMGSRLMTQLTLWQLLNLLLSQPRNLHPNNKVHSRTTISGTIPMQAQPNLWKLIMMISLSNLTSLKSSQLKKLKQPLLLLQDSTKFSETLVRQLLNPKLSPRTSISLATSPQLNLFNSSSLLRVPLIFSAIRLLLSQPNSLRSPSSSLTPWET